MPNGGELLITLSKGLQNTYVISFTDQGVGISYTQMEKLGEPFYTTKQCGTGLGLMMSYKIIQQHNGKIQIESELGRGTTVTVELPVFA